MPDSLTMRPARSDDAATIRRLVRGAGLDPTSLHWPNFLIAEAEGRIVGIGQIKPYRDAPELGSLVVVKSHRRQGVGAAIVQALIKRERADLFLFCRDRLEAYYARFGFQQVGARDLRGTLRWKYALTRLFRLFGVRIIVMRRLYTSDASG